MEIDLSVIWAIVILFGVMLYVIADGFDLGVGILFPLIPSKQHRDCMMTSVAPIWDGNETWLVLGGAGLLAAFPLAYAVILSALYLPILLMLIGLILRGVAFEARTKASEKVRHWWDKAFFFGSIIATFFQGTILGAFMSGIPVEHNRFSGHSLDWITPFALFCGLALIATYTLLGSTWLIMKTEGALQARIRELTRPLVWLLIAAMAVISLWTPLIQDVIAKRWFTWPNFFWLLPLPVLAVFLCYRLYDSIDDGETRPFILTLCIMALGFFGLSISLWPNIIPPTITIWDASAPSISQKFSLIGALAIIPVILIYTAWSYYVFRGKVSSESGYH